MKLAEFSVKQPVATLMLLLGLALLGGVSIFQLNIDMLPDIEPPVVSILTAWPGASASDVETEVTKEIEDRVNTVNNLDSLTSKSLDNLSVIVCKFNWGTDLDTATNDIRDQLELTKRDLPKDIEAPMLFKFSSATAPILFTTVTCDESWPRLYRIVDKKIADELRRVPGVGAIQIYGGLQRRINVYFDIQKINGYRLSLPLINQSLAAANINLPSGNIKAGLNDYFVRVPGRFQSIKDISDTIIGRFNDKPVYLRDVAEVRDDFKTQELNAWGDGKPGILMMLQRQTGKNTVEVIGRVRAKIQEIEKSLPADVRIHFVLDASENILTSVRNLRGSLGWGIFFVVLITFAMLRQFRPSLIIALSIPFSLIISFTFMYFFGYTINLVSLMALAIASGMVVDNGVVVLENIVRHLENGARPGPAAMFGANEMSLAITASSMTTVVIFVPMMFLTGLAGIIFKQLAFVLSITILGSLFTALTLTPMLSAKWLAADGFQSRTGILAGFQAISEKGFVALEGWYETLLAWALSHRKLVMAATVAVFAASLSLIPFLSTAFMASVDSGDLSVAFRMPEGTRLEETSRVVAQMLDDIDTVVKPEEFRGSYAFSGQTEEGKGVALGYDEGQNVGQIGLKLVDRDQRTRSTKEIARILRDRMEKIPGISQLKVQSQDPLMSILMGNAKPLILEIQGPDLDQLMGYARNLQSAMGRVDGLVDISISQKDPRPELWVVINRAKAADLGLDVAVIAMTLRNYFYGIAATQFRDAGDNFDIFTRLSETDKNNLDHLLEAPVFTRDGKMVRLKNVVEVTDGGGPIEIQRKNRQRYMKVEADLYGKSLGEGRAAVDKILSEMGAPEGVTVHFGGDVEEQQKAFRDLTGLLVLGVILVYMIMAALFGNLRDPFIIMFSVPFAFSGVFFAFYLFDVELGLMSFMGIIMLMGIVVNNAIVLVDYIHLLQKRGQKLFEAVTLAGKNRLRPVLITTITTFCGLIPMAFSESVGAEAWNPLGITMLGGLAVSTVVTLVLVPVIYYQFENRRLKKAKS